MSVGGYLYPRNGLLTSVDSAGGTCQIGGRRVELAWLFRVRMPSGIVYECDELVRRRRDIQQERVKEQQLIQRVQEDNTFVPQRGVGKIALVGEVPATVDGAQSTAYAFAEPGKTHFVLVLAKSRADVQRAMNVLYADVLYWDAVGVLVKSRLFWVHWHLLQVQCVELASTIRRGQPPLGHAPAHDRRDERTALYAQSGLSEEQYGTWVTTEWMEAYEGDWRSYFDWLEAVPTPVVTQFLTKAWASREFVGSNDEDLPASVLESFLAHGLAEREVLSPQTTAEMLSRVHAGDLRRWIAEAGSTFKSRSSQQLRDHLIELSPSFLEERLLRRQPAPRIRFRTPPGTTWHEFQDFRQGYRIMIETMLQWLYFGSVAPKADEFYAVGRKSPTT